MEREKLFFTKKSLTPQNDFLNTGKRSNVLNFLCRSDFGGFVKKQKTKHVLWKAWSFLDGMK
jgi:hypothetical protein